MTNSEGHFLDTFFYPKRLAIVGASGNPTSVNYNVTANMVRLGFTGKIYPVNPNATEVLGLKAYPDLKSIEDDIDLAVISVAASRTPGIVRDCIAKRVKGITIIAGGFSETGSDGKRAQDEIQELLKGSGIRAIGPNALSPINSRNNLIVAFAPVDKLPQGGLSIVFQSGLYEPRLNWLLNGFHLNLSKLIDLGNKMDITEVDALEYLSKDPETKVIAMHMESIAGDARKFMRLLKQTTREKPVIVLKTGRTAAGVKAASSHSGAIIKSSDAVVDVALRQSGAVRAQTLDDFFDLAKAFEYLPPLKGNRVAISTFPGGEAVMTADLCYFNGLSLAELSTETREKLRSVFPAWEIPVNPFDMGVSIQFHQSSESHGTLVSALREDPNVDCLAIQTGGLSSIDPEYLTRLLSEAAKAGKPVVTWEADPEAGKETVRQLESKRIPSYPSAERAIKALAGLYQYGAMQRKEV